MCNREIYDIGTNILYFQCFVTTDMFLFSISIFPEDLESSRRDLAFGSVKTRFKAILKKFVLGLDSLVGIFYGRLKTQMSFEGFNDGKGNKNKTNHQNRRNRF